MNSQMNQSALLQHCVRPFNDRISALRYFIAIHGEVPCQRILFPIDSEPVKQIVRDDYEITSYSDVRSISNESDSLITDATDDWFMTLNNSIVLSYESDEKQLTVLFKNENREPSNELLKKIRRLIPPSNNDKPELLIVTGNNGSLDLRPLETAATSLDISCHYNDDFQDVHTRILARLKVKNNKGLVLLHGKPGTGKTTYLRHIISNVNKPIIFIPPTFAGNLTDPHLITLLLEHPNSILVIEDAERIVVDRDRNGNSEASVLLNLADGLISDCLNIQVICTFNTDISKLDQALLRKGRLIAQYEFKPLSVHKANALLRLNNAASFTDQPMTLAEIFNSHDPDESSPPSSPIGFRTPSDE